MSLEVPHVFPEETIGMIQRALTNGASIDVDTATTIARSVDVDMGELMIKLLPIAASFARVPISGFQVGAIAQGGTGALYFGSNMEFSGHALSFSVHGEQAAVNHAWLSGETALKSLAINAAPCGYCRQFLSELTTPARDLRILMKTNAGDGVDHAYSAEPLDHYLPHAFGPADLDIKDRLMQVQNHELQLSESDDLVVAALRAANASYAPYTHSFSGVALQLTNGRIYTGRYAENAAYNPSMSPLESALALLNMSEPPLTPYEIEAAVLVEQAHGGISQKSVTEAVLSAVAPGVEVQYFAAT